MSLSYLEPLESSEKRYLRGHFLKKRREMLLSSPAEKEALDLEIQSRFLMSEEYRRSDTVLIYCARDFEIDTEGVILSAFSNGKRVAVPRCEDDGVMRFYLIRSLDDLREGQFHIREPREGCEPLFDFERSVCVCPALCCDMRGYRTGFGKGFYDRFLKDYTGETVSFCYSGSLIPEIQADPFDIPTQAVVTDSFMRHTGR